MSKVANINILELTGPQVAVLIGVSYPRLQQLLQEDDPPPRNEAKKYPTDQLGEWIKRRAVRMELGLRRGSTDPDDDSPKLNPVQERARKDKELADKAALENAVRRGELIEASQVGAKWIEIMTRVRARLLRIPFAAAPLLVGEEDQVKIQIALEDQVRDALTELSAD